MTNLDFHESCSHCLTIPDPLWPIADRAEWIMSMCHLQAITEEVERRIELSRQQKNARAQAEANKAAEKGKRLRDHKAKLLSTIREGRPSLLNIKHGGITHMAKKTQTEGGTVVEKPVKKTGLIDQLIRASAGGGYGEGEKDAIVAAVHDAFPSEDVKRLSGLFFSRRSQIKKAQEAQQQAA